MKCLYLFKLDSHSMQIAQHPNRYASAYLNEHRLLIDCANHLILIFLRTLFHFTLVYTNQSNWQKKWDWTFSVLFIYSQSILIMNGADRGRKTIGHFKQILRLSWWCLFIKFYASFYFAVSCMTNKVILQVAKNVRNVRCNSHWRQLKRWCMDIKSYKCEVHRLFIENSSTEDKPCSALKPTWR